MPNLQQYLKGFGLHKGNVYENFKLTEIQMEHNVIKRYHEYKYPTCLTFQWNGGKEGDFMAPSQAIVKKFLKSFKEDVVDESRTIYSAYGNPYECIFHNDQLYGPLEVQELHDKKCGFMIIIKCTGYATRLYE